jgi:hypothetical protein
MSLAKGAEATTPAAEKTVKRRTHVQNVKGGTFYAKKIKKWS